jgi:hypothetical protein
LGYGVQREQTVASKESIIMKTKITFTLIILLTTLQSQSMEYALIRPYNIQEESPQQKLLTNTQINYQALKHQQTPYQLQSNPLLNLPTEVIDKIIVYSKNYQNIKKTCQQFNFLSSINRLNNFIRHDFIIDNKKIKPNIIFSANGVVITDDLTITDGKEKSAFFKAFIKNNNPELIPIIYAYAEKKAQSSSNDATSDAVCITIDPAEKKREEEKQREKEKIYIQENYLHPLLQEALEQNNTIMKEKLTQYDRENTVSKAYKILLCDRRASLARCASCFTCCGLISLSIAAGFLTLVIFAIEEMIVCANITIHCID